MTEHSILSPSSFPRLVACPGSRKLEAMFPREESEAAAEGILAHKFASERIKLSYRMIHEFSVDVTSQSREMYDAVMIYAENVFDICKEKTPHVEERIDIPYLHLECFGTPDCWYYDEEKNEVHVWDFKYGFKPVEVRENWQLIGYASGVISFIAWDLIVNNDKIEECHPIIDKTTFNLHIVQPRARHREGSIRTWSLTRYALKEYERKLWVAVKESFLENPPLAVGAHCTYCKAKSICPQLKKESNMIVDEELKIEREFKSSSIEHFKKTIQECSTETERFVPCDGQKITREDMPGLFSALDSCLGKEEPEYDNDMRIDIVFRRICKLEEVISETYNPKETDHEFMVRVNSKLYGCDFKNNPYAAPMANGEWDDKQQVEEYLKPIGDQTLNQEILDTRRSIEILNLRLETLEKQALEEIQSGKEVPGFSAKKAWGRLGWRIPANDVKSLGEELGLNFTKPQKLELITPIQAMKLAKKDEEIKERIKSLASCKFNGYKLVAEGDASEDEEVNFDDL